MEDLLQIRVRGKAFDGDAVESLDASLSLQVRLGDINLCIDSCAIFADAIGRTRRVEYGAAFEASPWFADLFPAVIGAEAIAIRETQYLLLGEVCFPLSKNTAAISAVALYVGLCHSHAFRI